MVDKNTPSLHQQELLLVLIDSCSELQKRALHVIRFGVDGTSEHNIMKNSQRLAFAVGDLSCIFSTLINAKLIDIQLVDKAQALKEKALITELIIKP